MNIEQLTNMKYGEIQKYVKEMVTENKIKLNAKKQ